MHVDDRLKTPRRRGRPPSLTDAELVTLAVAQAMLGFHCEARWLRFAHAHLHGLFPYPPQRPAYTIWAVCWSACGRRGPVLAAQQGRRVLWGRSRCAGPHRERRQVAGGWSVRDHGAGDLWFALAGRVPGVPEHPVVVARGQSVGMGGACRGHPLGDRLPFFARGCGDTGEERQPAGGELLEPVGQWEFSCRASA